MALFSSGHIIPEKLVEGLIQSDPTKHLEQQWGSLLLVIHVPDDDKHFMDSLCHSVKQQTELSQEAPTWNHTAEYSRSSAPQESSDPDQVRLLSNLLSGSHCIVPLIGPHQTITLGRHSNSNIVLKDPSISAAHAELHIEMNQVSLQDMESKNGSFLNGRALEKGKLAWLQPMDSIRWGAVRAFVCTPLVLRSVLKQKIRPLL